MQTKMIEVADLEQLMIKNRDNITKAAEEIGLNRATLRRYINGDQSNVILVKDGDTFAPYVFDRRSGHHKKG
jgi:hypothetical protein